MRSLSMLLSDAPSCLMGDAINNCYTIRTIEDRTDRNAMIVTSKKQNNRNKINKSALWHCIAMSGKALNMLTLRKVLFL